LIFIRRFIAEKLSGKAMKKGTSYSFPSFAFHQFLCFMNGIMKKWEIHHFGTGIHPDPFFFAYDLFYENP
jgi:hypothetical protein